MQLKNYMEDVVWQKIDGIIAGHPGICSCEKCRYDIAAIALNHLPVRYVVTEKGEMFTKIQSLEQQFYIDIIAAITHGIDIVKKNPHHRHDE